MNQIDKYLNLPDSVGYIENVYMSTSGGFGLSNSDKKNTRKIFPRVVRTKEYDYPRLQKFFEWGEFLDFVDWKGQDWRRSSQKTDGAKYKDTLTNTFQGAMNLARYGWVEGLDKIKQMKKINFPAQECLRQNYDFQTRYSVAGGSVNIERYLSNIPNCMRHMHVSAKHSLPARIQKILVIGDYHKYISTYDVVVHGYTVYQIIDALEMANIQTEITLAFSCNKETMWARDDYDFYEVYIKIKNPTDIIYPEKLLFCIAHPSMLRRLMFSENEKNSVWVRNKFHFYSPGPGYGNNIPEWQPPEYMTKDTLVIPSLVNKDQMQNVLRKVRSLIQSQYDAVR